MLRLFSCVLCVFWFVLFVLLCAVFVSQCAVLEAEQHRTAGLTADASHPVWLLTPETQERDSDTPTAATAALSSQSSLDDPNVTPALSWQLQPLSPTMDLFVSCIVLCVTSLLAGWSPLFVHAPAKRRWMTTMGVGVLIGSAFVHVLPEAIHTTYLQPRSNQAQTRTQHARLAQTMHPSGVPSPSIDASSPASIAAWNPLSSIAAGAQHSSEEAALHNFKSKRGAPTPQPQSASASVTATRKLAHSHDAQQRHLLGADEPAVKPTKGAEQATKSSSTKDHSHEGHDHAHAGHSHAKDLVPPSRPAPVTSPRLVDDETAVGSHLLHRLQPAATVPPSAILVASTAASTDSVPEQLLACFGEDHPSKYMGALLALGFVAMLLVDRCAGRCTPATLQQS